MVDTTKCVQCRFIDTKETELPCNNCCHNGFMDNKTSPSQFQDREHHGLQCLFCESKQCLTNCHLDKKETN